MGSGHTRFFQGSFQRVTPAYHSEGLPQEKCPRDKVKHRRASCHQRALWVGNNGPPVALWVDLGPCLELQGQGAASLWPKRTGRGGQRGPGLLVGERESVGAKIPEIGQRREGRPLLGAGPTWIGQCSKRVLWMLEGSTQGGPQRAILGPAPASHQLQTRAFTQESHGFSSCVEHNP